MSDIQLGGNIMFAAQDVSDFVSRLTIMVSREAITRPPTHGKPRASTKAGAPAWSVMIDFLDEGLATDAHAILFEAAQTDSAELEFSATLEPGVVSATNPEYSGTMVVMAIEKGSTVLQLRSQSQTYPLTEDGIAKAVAP